MQNPFSKDPDRHAIWEMLVRRDIDAFLAADWDMVRNDFIAEGFLGLDGKKQPDLDHWRIGFPTLDAYRDEWLRQAKQTQGTLYAEPLREALFRATTLDDIDIQGDIAVAHKKFNGSIRLDNGGEDRLLWQTLYFCRRIGSVWKLSGFAGYLPYGAIAT